MTSPPAPAEQRPRTREARAAATQAQLLEATVSCLIELGFAGASTPVIARRAGVSRGAQTHHFPTRSALVTAAVEHLAERRVAQLRLAAASLPAGPDRVPSALDMLWASFGDELYQAVLELWIASRTDPELRACVGAAERRIGRQMTDLFSEMLGSAATSHPEFADRVQYALAELRGLAVLDTFDRSRAHRDQRWRYARRHLVELFTAETGRTPHA